MSQPTRGVDALANAARASTAAGTLCKHRSDFRVLVSPRCGCHTFAGAELDRPDSPVISSASPSYSTNNPACVTSHRSAFRGSAGGLS